MKRLIAHYGNVAEVIPLAVGRLSVGRDPDNDVILLAPGVSRRHAEIRILDRRVEVVDLGSKNRLIVAGVRCDRAQLTPGKVIQVGAGFLSLDEVSSTDAMPALALDGPAVTCDQPTGPTATASADELATGTAVIASIAHGPEPSREIAARGSWLGSVREALGAAALAEVVGTGIHGGIVACSSTVSPSRLADAVAAAVGAGRDRHSASGLEAGARKEIACIGNALIARRGTRHLLALYGTRPARRRRLDAVLHQCLGRLAENPPQTPQPPRRVQLRLDPPPGMVLGDGPTTRHLLDRLTPALTSKVDILLVGETGTGKELFARLIHRSGTDVDGPFVAVNCAALPADLLEAELFGIAPRTATGVAARTGMVARADGGTLLLDEIGDLPLGLQAKLLRFVQEREVQALGAPTPRPVRLRIVAATHRNLPAMVQAETFRSDLYYRLCHLVLTVPPLRERLEDLPQLALTLVAKASARLGRTVHGISRRALDRLAAHSWLGNVRELEATIRRAVLCCSPTGIIDSATIDSTLIGPVVGPQGTQTASQPVATTSVSVSSAGPPGTPTIRPLRARIAEVERDAIREALAHSASKALAAQRLGISRKGLRDKMCRLGLA